VIDRIHADISIGEIPPPGCSALIAGSQRSTELDLVVVIEPNFAVDGGVCIAEGCLAVTDEKVGGKGKLLTIGIRFRALSDQDDVLALGLGSLSQSHVSAPLALRQITGRIRPRHSPTFLHGSCQVRYVVEPLRFCGSGDDVGHHGTAVGLGVVSIEILDKTFDGRLVTGVIRVSRRQETIPPDLTQAGFQVIQEDSRPAFLRIDFQEARDEETLPSGIAWVHPPVIAGGRGSHPVAVRIQKEPIGVIRTDITEITGLIGDLIVGRACRAVARILDPLRAIVLRDNGCESVCS
jgi:hypothetical protein